MKQVAGLISTYSSDEFGICSALYELGGMVVMHDASGCNSTYTTHDEPRWYDMDSMIFISAISEAEAIMGDDDKFICDLVETAGELHPEFIALVGAPIPYMIGTDLQAIAQIVSDETGIPCFGFAANGMNHYTRGISMALEQMTDTFALIDTDEAAEIDAKKMIVNILGATPLDFSLNGSVESIKQWIEAHDMRPGVCLSMGCSLEDVKQLGRAHVNLVVSYGGLAAAKLLEKRFGIPYVVGVPFGESFSNRLAAVLKQAAAVKMSYCGYKIEESSYSDERILIIGESVFSASLAEAIEMDTGCHVKVLCPLDTREELLRKGDARTPEEDDLIHEFEKADVVIADPLYRSLIQTQRFYELPHEAFSGRMYDEKNPNLIAKRIRILGEAE